MYNYMHIASLAQLVEHLICNQRVVGSSPTTGTRIKKTESSDSVFWVLIWVFCVGTFGLALFNRIRHTFNLQQLVFQCGTFRIFITRFFIWLG